jgi:hypothetical protein
MQKAIDVVLIAILVIMSIIIAAALAPSWQVIFCHLANT